MPLRRFNAILRFIRFNNAITRPERQVLSKSAPIDDIWMMLNANLERVYEPGVNLTVDEQLFPYRGRTRFTQYIPFKPAKYGIKVWWICDSKSHFPLKGTIYTGKLEGQERAVNQGENVVFDLTRRLKNTGRTIYCDNFFTSLPLAQGLMADKLAIVGTLRASKRCIPTEFKQSKNRPIYQTRFGFLNNNISLCSYVPKKKKAVILMSTQHYYCSIDENNVRRKPSQILDYNEHKAGVPKLIPTYFIKIQ